MALAGAFRNATDLLKLGDREGVGGLDELLQLLLDLEAIVVESSDPQIQLLVPCCWCCWCRAACLGAGAVAASVLVLVHCC